MFNYFRLSNHALPYEEVMGISTLEQPLEYFAIKWDSNTEEGGAVP
ncbi:hypothetical protein [Alteribacillus sp. YIM 98480]|nr:hypothetical protein [Alteribacillus sp. YIM 98480]